MAKQNKKNRKRDISYKVYVDESEDLMIKERMERVKILNKSDYARKMMIDGLIVVTDYAPVKDLAIQISKVGNNINQIARQINQSKNVHPESIVELKKMLNDISQQQAKTLKLLMKPLE